MQVFVLYNSLVLQGPGHRPEAFIAGARRDHPQLAFWHNHSCVLRKNARICVAHPHELASGLLSREKANVGSETVDVSLLENQKSYESDSED